MYNRYTPTPGGQYQRKPSGAEASARPTAGAAVFPGPPPAPQPPGPPPCPPRRPVRRAPPLRLPFLEG